MLTEFLQDRAALYVSGDMDAAQREQFEILLEFHHELRTFVAGLSDLGAALTIAATRSDVSGPSPEIKARISDLVRGRPQQTSSEALVVAGPDGLVQWVNTAFSNMCGYSLDELRGKKLGPILQGADTDQATVERLRAGMRALRPCHETLLNYHKNGTPYWVDIDITPILDDAGAPVWLVAREREIAA